MKLFFLTIFIVLGFTNYSNSQVTLQWDKRYNGPSSSVDEAKVTKVDPAGNVYVTGKSDSIAGNSDFLTIKYNSDGIQQWVSRYNGPGNSADYPNSMAVDATGNIYVTGASIGNGTSYDMATIKYDTNGNILWIARYNGPENEFDESKSLAVDGSGNVFITGKSYSNSSDFGFLTIKYNSSGIQQWVRNYRQSYLHFSNRGEAVSIALDNSGNAYVTGKSYVSAYSDIVTIKYNTAGDSLWVAGFNDPSYGNQKIATAVAVDNSGSVFVTGYVFDGSTGYDYLTIKFNNSGVLQWVNRYNGPGNGQDVTTSMVTDNSGNAFVTGNSNGGSSTFDFATIKYNESGVQEWVQRYNGIGASTDFPYSIALDILGNVYVTGTQNSYYYATIKYNTGGVQQWIRKYPEPLITNNIANSVCLDNSGNVYVTGRSNRFGTNYDFVTLKYSPDFPLPVELVSFSSNVINASVELKWTTSSEINNSGFEIERSADNESWINLGFVQGIGNSTIQNDYSYTDKNLVSGKYFYHLKQIDFNGNFEYFKLVNEVVIGVPDKFELLQNYPNPFNPTTNIEFGIPESGFVSLKIYDILGNEVAALVNENLSPGSYQVQWDGNAFSSGVYYYKLETNTFSETKKMFLLK